MNYEAKYLAFKQTEGWIEKKSPRLMVGFQKRYFTIFEDGTIVYLLYDKFPPSKEKKPKGAIQIILMKEVITKENSREFTLKFSTRDFVLRASSVENKKQWIAALEFLREYSLKNQGNKPVQEMKGKEAWRFEKLDQETQRNLRIHIEKKNQDEEDIKEIEIKDEQMQKAKGIFEYFENYSEEVLTNHIVQGFLYRKKESLQTKVVQPSLFWFFMYSEGGLVSTTSQNQFQIDDLPPFINPNVLYVYDATLTESHPHRKYHIRDIKEIRKTNLKTNEGDNLITKGFENIGNGVITTFNKITEITKLDKIGMKIHRFEFQFQIVVTKKGKDSTINFYSESLLQIEKWVSSLTRVMNAYKAKQEEIEKRQKAKESLKHSLNRDKSKSTNDSDQDEEESATSDNQEDDDYDEESWRELVIFKAQVKTKVKTILNVVGGWGDRFTVLRRQIIILYQEEQDMIEDTYDQYVLIKDIQSVKEDKKEDKFSVILKKSKEQRFFTMPSKQEARQWMHAINMLIENDNADIDELRRDPKSVEVESSTQKSKKEIEKGKHDNCALEESHGTDATESSFYAIDQSYKKAFSEGRAFPLNSIHGEADKKNNSGGFFSTLFGCCVSDRAETVEAEEKLRVEKSGKRGKITSNMIV